MHQCTYKLVSSNYESGPRIVKYKTRLILAKTYKVENIDKAFELAKRFELEGKYNLFRGQAKNWEVISTAGRLSSIKLSESVQKLERLLYYFSKENSLKKYCQRVDSFFAIAQHYGLATNYIDFTTDVKVAFYFATNSKDNKIGEECSIICLNENAFKEFVSFSKILYRNLNFVPPYISKINVDNLWRLQAQSGCFLFTPFPNIETLYDFDRITFPFSENFKGLTISDIYPIRKSEIEILLDIYFNAEEKISGVKRLQNFIDENNLPVTRLSHQNNYEILKKKEIHKSWKSSFHRKWEFSLTETLSNIKETIKIELVFSRNLALQKQKNKFKKTLTEYFLNYGIRRNTFIEFDFISNSKLSKKIRDSLIRNASLIWEGSRNLPFSEDEIIDIISTYLSLELSKNHFGKMEYSVSNEKLITLELANKYGGRTRCKASPSKIVNAFRDDINEIIINSMSRPIPSELLLHVNAPRYIFDFKKLLDLFKTELIAYQVLENSTNCNPVIFFSPSQLEIIGYA